MENTLVIVGSLVALFVGLINWIKDIMEAGHKEQQDCDDAILKLERRMNNLEAQNAKMRYKAKQWFMAFKKEREFNQRLVTLLTDNLQSAIIPSLRPTKQGTVKHASTSFILKPQPN